MTIGSVVLAVVGFFMLGSGVVNQVGNILDFRDNLAGEAEVPGTTEMVLEADTQYNVLAIGDDLVYSSGSDDFSDTVIADFDEPDVTITDPDGNEVELGTPIQTTFDMPETDAVAISDFHSGDAGTYTMVVEGSGGAVDAVGVGDALTFDDLKDFTGSAVALVVAGFAAMIGLPMLIGGIIWAVSSKSRTGGPRGPSGPGRYQPPTWGPPGGYPAPGGYGPPGSQGGGWS